MSRTIAPRLLTTLLLLLLGCEIPTDLPPPPPFEVTPTITDFSPHGAFGWQDITIVGTGFDATPENNQVLFQGGLTVTGNAGSTTEKLIVTVPADLMLTGPLIVKNRYAASVPSTQSFYPMGRGHPTLGTLVADLRFRHHPVGIMNTALTTTIASSLFDVLALDTGRFAWLSGRPVTFVREVESKTLVSVRTAHGGQVAEIDVDATDDGLVAQSAEDSVVEAIVLPIPPASDALVAESIGADQQGRMWLSTWSRSGQTLVPTRRAITPTDVTGATYYQGNLFIIATLPTEPLVDRVLARLDADGPHVLFRPAHAEDTPTGAIAVIDADGGPVVAVALANGDIACVPLDGSPWRRIQTISYATVPGLIASPTHGKILVTKSTDAALLQYDVVTGALDWSVQLHGAPTILDYAPDMNQVTVANADDNDVDILEGTTGKWLGRVSFSLGLGTADGGEGGIVAPYTFDPDQTVGFSRPNVLHVLARNARMVLALNPDTLQVVDTVRLDEGDDNEPIRLAVTNDFRTLVVHRHALGVVDTTSETIVAKNLPAIPRSVAVLADNRIVVGSLGRVDVYAWDGPTLATAGGLMFPNGVSLVGLVANGTDVFLLTRGPDGFSGGLYTADALVVGGAPKTPFDLANTVGNPVGMAWFYDGPGALFGLSPLGGPAFYSLAALTGAKPPQASLVERPLLSGTSPDGYVALWLDDSGGEHTASLLIYDGWDPAYPDYPPFSHWASYRLEGQPAGPGFDASGEWLYVPVPESDMISVFQ